MSHKIDNDKMWASLIKNWVEAYSIDRSTVNTVFDKALEEQGLKLNGDFEIVEIDPQIRDAVEDNFYSMLDDSAVKKESVGKFKIGDWVASNICNSSDLLHIIDVDNTNYEVETPFGNTGVPSLEYVDKHFHLWTIDDAKDGDFLTIDYGTYNWVGIFKELTMNGDMLNLYCSVTDNGKFTKSHKLYQIDYARIRPSTKDERDRLLKAMKEAGYEWDKTNNELKPLEEAWEPKDGDRVRLKGTTEPIYHLCSKDGYGCFSFVQEMESGIAGGSIYIATLKKDYELVDSYSERLNHVKDSMMNSIKEKNTDITDLSDFEKKLYDLIVKAKNTCSYTDDFKEFVKKHSNEFNL